MLKKLSTKFNKLSFSLFNKVLKLLFDWCINKLYNILFLTISILNKTGKLSEKYFIILFFCLKILTLISIFSLFLSISLFSFVLSNSLFSLLLSISLFSFVLFLCFVLFLFLFFVLFLSKIIFLKFLYLLLFKNNISSYFISDHHFFKIFFDNSYAWVIIFFLIWLS